MSLFKLHVNAPNDVMALKLRNTIYNWGHISEAEVNGALTCAWVVRYNNKDNFFVTGSGLSIAKLGFWTSSDVNIKENIIPVNDALNKIKLLRGVYFNYKTEQLHDSAMGGTIIAADLKRYMGLIAQEVEPVIPEVVTTDNTGRKAVAYQNLIGLLIEAMKEQQNQIELLSSQVSQCCGYAPLSMQNLLKLTTDTTLNDSLKKKIILGKDANLTGINNNEQSSNQNKLFQNNPNPFNQNTIIEYEIINSFNKAAIYVYNYQGEQLKSYEIYSKGKGSINIKASDFKAGMYFYDLIVDNKSVGAKKMVLTQ